MAVLRPYGVLGSPGDGIAVADGFTKAGFLFGPLWLAWHGLWLPGALWLAAMAGAAGVLVALGADDTVFAILCLTGALVIGWEGQGWRLVALARRGQVLPTVLARSADEALFLAARGRP